MKYIKPEFEVVEFELIDVIQTSNGTDNTPEVDKEDALPVG